MISKHCFLKHFSGRMLFLAVFTGLIIITSMPLTYYLLSMQEERKEGKIHGRQIALYLTESVKENPQLWQFNAQKFVEVFSNPELDEIGTVKIYNNNGSLIHTETVSEPSLFSISTRSAIRYNNNNYGFIEITEKSDKVINNTLFLLLFSTAIGVTVSLLLYRFPTEIVAKAENSTLSAIKQLNYLLLHDSLTDLANRMKLEQDMTEILKNAQEKLFGVAVMFLDLDRFKYVNDTLGHSSGDILLKDVADRLLSFTRKGEVIARQGGDEFVIVIPESHHVKDIQKRAQEIIDGLARAFELNQNEYYITTSIGISIFPADGDDVHTLLKHADVAMYQAKQQGKNKFYFYNKELDNSLSRRLALECGLRRAVERGEFQVYYQPIVNCRTRNLEGVEALVRWNHPEFGLLMPSEFIRLAEEMGLIVQIGEWVLRTACEQNKAWQKQGLQPMLVSVNLSPYQFHQRSLEKLISTLLKQSELQPQYLMVEITENAAAYNEEQFFRKLKALKRLGVRIAIDDFGTGYCSFNYLKEFQADFLKIDRTFIRDMETSSKGGTIVNAIIALSKNLNIEVIAEGVETEEQRDYLAYNQCYLIQGFLFGKPLPPGEFIQTLSNMQKMVV